MAKKRPKKSPAGIQLGSLVKDRITGFQGIATAQTEFGFGCIHVQIQAQRLTKDGDPVPTQSFDDQRVELISPPTRKWPSPHDSTVKLGDFVRDVITGASGTATGRTVSLDGRVKILIEQQGVTELGDPKSALITLAERLEVIDRRDLTVSATSAATSGGPMARLPRPV